VYNSSLHAKSPTYRIKILSFQNQMKIFNTKIEQISDVLTSPSSRPAVPQNAPQTFIPTYSQPPRRTGSNLPVNNLPRIDEKSTGARDCTFYETTTGRSSKDGIYSLNGIRNPKTGQVRHGPWDTPF